MNHAEHDESIGSMLASIATALREVSDKLDIVAARVQLDVPTFPVDEDLPDHTRIRRLESWAFRASQDISRLSSRLDALDNDGEPDSGRPARSTPSRREIREAAEAAERAADGLDDHQAAPESLPPHRDRDIDRSRPPLERRNSPVRPTTDHLGDPTALAATPIPRTAEAAAAPLGQPASFDTDSAVTVGGNAAGSEPPSRRPAPVRLSSTGERVSAGNPTSTNGTNGTAKGVAGDIASTRNGTPVPAVIGTVLTAPVVDPAPGTSASTATKPTATVLSEDRPATSGVNDNSTASSATDGPLPGSAEVSAVVRESGPNGFGLGSGARKHDPSSPAEAQSARPAPGDPLTAEISPDAVIERARPVKKPTESSVTGDGRLRVPSPEELSPNGNGVARPAPTEPVHAADDHSPSGFTGERSATPPNGKPVNGFDSHSPLAGEIRPDTSVDAQPVGNTANGIHWSFTDDPAPTSPAPDRNGHARNGFTTDSARRAESLFDDFTPRDRMTTGESPEPPAASGPPPRLTPPAELTTQPNQTPAEPARTPGSSHVNGVGDSTAFPSTDRPANTGALPDQAPRNNHATLTDHDHPSADFDPPTLGLPTGRDGSASNPDPLARAASDPVPPTATDSAGITVTGTYRAFDIERAHVDKLQAMLDELKRSAGLPPGRRDVFGPPTPDVG
ncbi:hypothetical protein ACWF99_07610 [Nocardia sp. NPDC055002]